MANRKVLINRHTSGNTAPNAAEMYKGEIAVAHKTGEEILWTKNNANEMVPFISCAQTISIVSGMIENADVTYDVQAAENDEHVEVTPGGTDSAKVFTVSSKDVQSEEEFKAYSAATKVRIDGNASAITDLTAVVSALTDIVVTGITGDAIITATVNEPTTGANQYTLTHKTGETTSGFNKLSTDGYGHVTASTAVAASDIEALGFKDSAWTEEAITNAINELDSTVSASSAGKYFTALAIENGKLVAKEEADIPTLEVESAGTGNVVEAITVNGHKITYTTTSVATSHDIEELSATTASFSAGTYSEFTSAFTAINNLSADTHNRLESVYDSATTYADELIAALDSATAVTAGKYMTGIAIADGKISGITEADLPELSKVVSGAGNVFTDIEVNDHEIIINKGMTVASDEDLRTLSGATEAISGYAHDEIAQLSGATEAISGYAHDEIAQLSAGTLHDIEVLSGAVKANETNINTVSGDVIELSAATVAIETGLDNLSAVTLTGVSLNNTPLAVNNHIVSVPVAVDASGIENASDSGTIADAKAVKEYVEGIVSSAVNYKGATSSEPSNPTVGDLYIADTAFDLSNGKHVEVGDFIIYGGEEGSETWDVIEKNLDGAITGNLTADTVTLGASLNSVKSLANGSAGQVLTIGTAGTPVWADDPVLSTATTGNGNVVSEITVNDHEITYVKNFTAATNADLEIVSGIVDTFSAATVAEFNSAFTAINTLSADAHNSMIARDDAVFSSAVTYIDEQIDEVYASAVSYTNSAITYAIEGLDSTGSVSTTGHYLTSVTITDGKITAVGEEEVPAATPVTTVAGTTGDTAAAVLSEIVTGGTDGHQLTLNMTNKVFSATTADSALTSESAITSLSAQTSVSANMAYELSSAATITSGQVTDFVEGVENIKVNSAYTAESADTAAKVANALSVSGYSDSSASTLDSSFAYDGSEAKSLTFGTNGPAGLKSMSMTSAGLVDVEVIDCGEY